MAIAILYSVTVSMAALITGTLSLILLVSLVESSTSAGSTSLSAGTKHVIKREPLTDKTALYKS